MTSGFTNPWDGCRAAMSCRLVVSVVQKSIKHGYRGAMSGSSKFASADIFKISILCKLSNHRYIAYIIQCVFTVHCSFTSQTVWQLWVSGHVICLSGFYATRVVGGWRDSWVRDYGWERQRGSKQGSYIQADCAVPGLTPEARRLTAIAIMWWSWRGEWSRRERRVITTALLSVATSNTINDRRLFHSRHAGLQPCMFSFSAGYILPTPGCWFH